MRIGISLLHVLPGGIFGSETYIRNLLPGLASVDSSNEYFLFTNPDNHETFQVADDRFHRVLCPIEARPQLRRVAFEQFMLPHLASRYRLDVLHSPSYAVPLATRCASVVSILDMLYRVYPRIIPQPKRLYWQISVPLSARRSHVVLTISENSRHDIMKYLGTAADKIVVSHLAVDDRLVKARLAQEGHQAPGKLARKPLPTEPYVFTLINSIKGHKNLLGLITAFRICHAKLPGFKLVVGGGAGIEAETRRIVESHGLTEAVLITDYLSLEEMAWLYAHASAYIIPSLFEGFGLPALEAMSFGVPVTCSDAGSLPEVVNDAGLFFNPKDSVEMANCLGRILTDDALRADLIQKGRRRVSEFSWQETARKTLSAYELALDRKKLGVR